MEQNQKQFVDALARYKFCKNVIQFISMFIELHYYFCLVSQGCVHFAEILSKLTKTWSSEATECRA